MCTLSLTMHGDKKPACQDLFISHAKGTRPKILARAHVRGTLDTRSCDMRRADLWK